MNKALFLPLMVALAACSRATAPPPPPPLAGAAIGAPLNLIDQNGRAVREADFAGKYRIVYFGYTFCPDVCPTDVATIVRGWRAFTKADPARAARIQPIFVTVDPARDTPAVLKTFAAAFDPQLVALTGTPEQIAAVAKGFGVTYQAQPARNDGAYLVDHSRTALLMDPQGKPLALLSQEASPDTVARELSQWVK